MAFVGKVALITGAARGIGAACARALGAKGAKVILADVAAEEAAQRCAELRAAGIDASPCAGDVANRADADAMVAHTVRTFGGLDVLIANAGIVRAAPFLDMTEEDFDEVIRVNLKGVFLTSQAAARQMVAQNQATPGRGGCIVTMSSVNAELAIPTIAGYNASKGGVSNLTRCMALALAPHGIRVNAVGPGSIMTDVLSSVANDAEARDRILSRTPLGRIGAPAEVAEVATFLASDASSYMTGQVVFVDGGRMALNYTMPVPKPNA